MNLFSTALLFIFLSISCCFTQNKNNKQLIKKVTSTETIRQLYTDGTYHNKTIETNETSYCQDGLILENVRTLYKDSKPQNKNTTTYFYNEENKIKHTVSVIGNDSTTFKTYYYYKNNLLVEKSFKYIKDEKVYSFKEVYNHTNKRLTSSNYKYFEKYIDSDNQSFITKYEVREKYDKKERTIEIDFTESDSIYEHNILRYKWKKNNLLSQKKEFNKKGKLLSKTTFKYKFDLNKNWIIKSEYKDKKLYKLTYRTIEYYN